MKKHLSIPLFLGSITLAMGAAAGVILSKHNSKSQEPKMAEASANNNYTLGAASFFERDSDPANNFYYTQSDLSNNQSSISGLSVGESGTGDSTNIQLREGSLNKKWHAIYQPFSYSITVAAHTKVDLTFTYNYSTSKTTDGGAADHVCEFFYYDVHTPTLLQLICGKDNSAQNSSMGTGFTGCFNERVYSNAAATVSSGNKTFSFSANNSSKDSATTYTLNFALFGYIEQSNSQHQWIGSLSLSASRNTQTYICSATNGSNTTYHQSFTAAINAVGDDGTINMFSNYTQSDSGYPLSKSVNVVLNGKTLTFSGNGASVFNVYTSGKTLRISGGTIQASNFQMLVNVVAGATFSASSLTMRNTDSGSGRGYGIVVPGGTVSLYNTTIYTPYNFGIFMRNGATVSIYGTSQITASSGASIRAQIDDGSSSVNTIEIGDTASFDKTVSCDLITRMRIRPYSGSRPYSGTATINFSFGTTPSASDIFLYKPSYPNSIDYSLFVIDGLPGYMETKSTTIDGALVVIVDYRMITLSTTLSTHLSLTGSSYFSANGNKTVTLVSSNSKYYALPSSITLKRGSTTLASGTAYTYNSSTGAITIMQAYMIDYSFSLTANEVVTDAGYVNAFVDTYMHMADYDKLHNNVNGKGWCNDEEHHYYLTAKQGFNALTSAQKEIFKTDSDFEEAHNRYLAWATACGDTQPYVGTTINNTSNVITISKDNSVSVVLVAMIIVVSSSTMLSIFLFIKKRKHK